MKPKRCICGKKSLRLSHLETTFNMLYNEQRVIEYYYCESCGRYTKKTRHINTTQEPLPIPLKDHLH